MIHFFFSFFLVFSSVSVYSQQGEKIMLNCVSNEAGFTSDSSELVITTYVKNRLKKTYYMDSENRFTTCNNLSFFWLIDIRFQDSTKLFRNCILIKTYPLSKWMSSKLRSDSTTLVTFKVDLKTLLSQDDYIKGNIFQNSHFGNYTATVSYCDRDGLNNKHQTEVFTSNKIYFTYQK